MSTAKPATTPSGRQPPVQTTFDDWKRSDAYHNSFLLAEDPTLDKVQKHSHEEGLPHIEVSAAQGKFLHLLVKSTGAKRVLEVGTLAGYSTIWLARAVPDDGSVVTLELEEKHAKASIAKENFSTAGVSDKVAVIVGPAAETIKKLEPNPPFDFAFIDADKEGNLTYFNEAKRLVRSGGVIMVDNVVRNARVSNPENTDSSIEGVRNLLKAIKEDKEVDATTIGTVGDKGYDGFLYAVRK